MLISTDTAADAQHPPAQDELAAALFRDGPNGEREQDFWREAISTGLFRYRSGLRDEERCQLTYDRLRALNAELSSPERLARDPRGLAALHEWTSVVDGATATVAGIHYNLFLGSLLDDELSPPRDLSEFTALTRTGTFLCTEQAHGNDAPALETVARYDRERDEFVLHTPHEGARKYMPNTSWTGGPKSAVVAARLLIGDQDHGVFLFLTPLSDHRGFLPGVSVEPMPERVGSPVDHCVTGFHQLRLPRTALIQGPHGRLLPDGTLTSSIGNSRKRFLSAIGRVTTGKLCMSASVLGGSRAALAIAARYAYTRQVSHPAGGRAPLAAHRSHHAPLVERVATAYAMTFLHRTVMEAWLSHSPENRTETERLVAVAKGWITWRGRDITIESRERCGARGLFPVNGLAESTANIDGAITAEGDNLPIWCKAGAEMIFDHAVPHEPGKATGRESLTDPAFLRQAVAVAERHWHATARQDLRHGKPSPALGRWNRASAAALDLVEAYVVGQAADAFAAACAGVTDPPTRALLDQLHTLFLLRQVDSRSGLLLAEGALTVAQVRALRETELDVTDQLAPHLLRLTEAFRIPEEHLSSLPMLTTE